MGTLRLFKNLIMLRNVHGFSHKEIAEKIGISYQAYAKRESGVIVTGIEECKCLADIYDIMIVGLTKTE